MIEDSPSGGLVVNGHHITLGQIARGTGITRAHISRVFSGKRVPSLPVLVTLSGYLGVTNDALIAFLAPKMPQPLEREAEDVV